MSAAAKDDDPLAGFARAHGLLLAERAELPAKGGLLSEDDLEQEGSRDRRPGPGRARNPLPAHLHLPLQRHHPHRQAHRRGPAGPGVDRLRPLPRRPRAARDQALDTKRVELDGGGWVLAADGVNDAWLTELFSPAFTQWLAPQPRGLRLGARRRRPLRLARRPPEQGVGARGTVRRRRPYRGHDPRGMPGGGRLRRREADRGEGEEAQAHTTSSSTRSSPGPASTTRRPTSPRHDPSSATLVVRHPSTYFISIFMTLVWMLGHQRDRRRDLRPPAQPAEPRPCGADLRALPVRDRRFLRASQPDQRHLRAARRRRASGGEYAKARGLRSEDPAGVRRHPREGRVCPGSPSG